MGKLERASGGVTLGQQRESGVSLALEREREKGGMKVERTGVCAATRETIWRTCFEDVEQWNKWDPDMDKVTDATGPCETGTTMTFHLKDGGKFPMKCENVVKHERLGFTGKFLLGMAGAEGTIVLKDRAGSTAAAPETEVTYTFKLSGLLGSVFGRMNAKGITHGTEEGLANVVKLSQEAQTTQQG